MSVIHSTQSANGYLKTIASFPCTLVSSALHAVAHKVRLLFQKILGYCLRTVVFMFGEYKSSPFKHFIMEKCGKGGPCDTRGRKQFDPSRLEKRRDCFKCLGCEVDENGDFPFAIPKDGQAKIEYCHIKYEKVKETIEKNGGEWIELPAIEETENQWLELGSGEEGTKIEVILQNEKVPIETWKNFYENTLVKMGWTPINLTRNGKSIQALLTAKWDPKQERPLPGLCFIRSHSPTSSWAMEYRYVGKQLSLHADLFLYDYRGTCKSEGIPSEGGYYLDLKAIYEEAKKRGYANEHIFATGFCLGGAVASSLRREEEVNLIVENYFDSLTRVIDHYPSPIRCLGKPIKWLAKIGLPEIQAKEKEPLTHQNYFNLVENLTEAKPNKNRIHILINTNPDTLPAPDSFQRTSETAAKVGSVSRITFNCKVTNGHSLDPLADPSTWSKYVEEITRFSRSLQLA